MMRSANCSVVAAIGLFMVSGCIRPQLRASVDNPTNVQVNQIWEEPADLEKRDLFLGPGSRSLMPATATALEFLAEDRTGYSLGYDVRDARGVEWSVKVGPEAQSEVAVSRLLWALGFHQPPTYYVANWRMTGAPIGTPRVPGRFRPEQPTWNVVEDWSWYQNAFVDTQPFKGLVVANLMFNNWDWKTSNNKVYEIDEKRDGRPGRIYVVRDLGASLGKTSFPQLLNWFPMRGLGQGSRNDVEDFESQGFIKRVEGERVEFDYRGIHGNIVRTLSRSDVVWTSRLMSRLSDRQWNDAFRAAGYSDDHARRFVDKIKSKVAEGLALGKG
jgi:hypothetical protein